MKAIETKYKGYRFRSRLEARWAVFFDALGLQWEYEPEGFDLGEAGWYLPDFRIDNKELGVIYVEVKGGIDSGVNVSDKDFSKLLGFSLSLPKDNELWLLGGIPAYGKEYVFPVFKKGINYGVNVNYCLFDTVSSMIFAEKINTRVMWRWLDDFKLKDCFFANGCISPYAKARLESGDIGCTNVICVRGNGLIIDAATKSRSARFEHGEQG